MQKHSYAMPGPMEGQHGRKETRLISEEQKTKTAGSCKKLLDKLSSLVLCHHSLTIFRACCFHLNLQNISK